MPDFAEMFADGSPWVFAPSAFCRRVGISPHLLAYEPKMKRLGLIVARSRRGRDFALSVAGINYLRSALDKGQTSDGKPVAEAFVILAESRDPEAAMPNARSLLNFVAAGPLAIVQANLTGGTPEPGRSGSPFWWIGTDELETGWSQP